MINPQTLVQLTTLRTYALSRLLEMSGYTGVSFRAADFVGINDAGEFCYSVTYHDEDGTGETTGKVFVKYDHKTNVITADL